MSRSPDPFPTSAFEYELPPERIAQSPSARRDESRLLTLDRQSGQITDRVFHDLVEMIEPGDAVVLNETRVFPARLIGQRASGAHAEVFLLAPVHRSADDDAERYSSPADPARSAENPGSSTLWRALVRPGSKLRAGRSVTIAPDLHIQIVEVETDGTRIVRLETPRELHDALERYGHVPLPPYVDRKPGPGDHERYQTVYARETGSVAAPTAGLHLTQSMLDSIEEKDASLVKVLLHVGAGTFRPVEAEDPADHPMHAERYTVSRGAADTLNRTRAAGGTVWAVGTTVARVLETVISEDGTLRPGQGTTRLFIRPPYRFEAFDRLITNFHLPRSTLLMLVAAFGGYERVMEAYRHAISAGYRFYSYGDAMAIV